MSTLTMILLVVLVSVYLAVEIYDEFFRDRKYKVEIDESYKKYRARSKK